MSEPWPIVFLKRPMEAMEAETAASSHTAVYYPPPSVEIVEQPVGFYRFRYESEVTAGRVGGLLLGRRSSGSSKSYIKVRISGISARCHVKLRLTACTVNPDKAPHPFYLHGDNCTDGTFVLEKSVDERTQSSLEVAFDRLAVICIPKTPNAIREAERRRSSVPLLEGCPVQPLHPYDSRNLGRIRLAFVLRALDHSGQWTEVQAFSDEISDKKEDKSLDLDDLNPPEVAPQGGTEIAIYTKSPTTGINKNDATVSFTFQEEGQEGKSVRTICSVTEVKKHLITVNSPNVSRWIANERFKAVVTVQVGDAISSELNIVFDNALTRTAPTIKKVGRKRAM